MTTDVASELASLRSLVRSRRRGNVTKGDLLYRAYVTGLLSLVGFYLALGFVDDAPIEQAQIDWVRDHGPAWIGLLAASLIAAGLRSGANGGPLAIDEIDLHHLVMSPLDRALVLADPVRRMIIGGSVVAVLIGAVAGELASRQLPGLATEWIGAATLAALTAVLAGIGAALTASSLEGLRRKPWVVSALVTVLFGWAILDVSQGWETAPSTIIGHLALLPLTFAWWPLLAPVLALGLLEYGRRVIVKMSIERAARRAHLVRQVRFALAQQDIRSLILLRRQLGFERPRKVPLFRIGPGRFEDSAPAMYRDARSYLRWPLSRIVRVGSLALVAGISLAGVWRGTTALALTFTVASYLMALEAVEPYSQELDHPSILDAVPTGAGKVLVSHLLASTLLLAGLQTVAGLVAFGFTRSSDLLAVVAVGVLPGAAAAAAGGALSIKKVGASGQASMPMPDEMAGPGAVIRIAMPVALAGLASLSVIVARNSLLSGQDPVAIATTVSVVIGLVALGLFAWIRFGDEMSAAAMAAQK